MVLSTGALLLPEQQAGPRCRSGLVLTWMKPYKAPAVSFRCKPCEAKAGISLLGGNCVSVLHK